MSALLLLLLAGALLPRFYGPVAALLVLAVGLYWAVEFLAPPESRSAHTVRLGLALFVILSIATFLTGVEMLLRQAEGAATHIHDGAIQAEEAMRFVLAGRNPYAESYAGTPMADWAYWPGNPALEHLPYLPATFVLPLPLLLVVERLTGSFDIRLRNLLLFTITLLFLPQLASSKERGLAALVAFGLNPMLVPFIAEGRNDVVILAWLVAAVCAWQNGRTATAALLLALASATKQTVWFVVPFFALLAWQRPERLRLAVGFALPWLLLVAPFVLWNPGAFVDDAFRFQSSIYPVKGWGLSQILLAAGAIPDETAPFPFTLLQLAAGGLALGWLARRQRRANTLPNALLHGGMLTGVVLFLGRAFLDNYFGYLAGVLVLARASGASGGSAAAIERSPLVEYVRG